MQDSERTTKKKTAIHVKPPGDELLNLQVIRVYLRQLVTKLWLIVLSSESMDRARVNVLLGGCGSPTQ